MNNEMKNLFAQKEKFIECNLPDNAINLLYNTCNKKYSIEEIKIAYKEWRKNYIGLKNVL